MFSFPKIIRQFLPNGLEAILVPDHEQQGLTLALQVPAGEFSDPETFEGTAELTLGVLQKGTAELTPEEFSGKLEQTGATLFAESGDEHIVIGCKMLSRHATTIIPLFCEMLLKPRFDASELKRLKREMITALQTEYSDPNALASKHFFPLLSGTKHPAGRVHTIRSIQRITLECVRSFYDDYFSPRGSVVVIAGNFFLQEFETQWSPLFAGWQSRQGRTPCIAQPLPTLSETKIRIVDKKDITQTSLIMGYPVPGELSPDHNALALANYLLGGGNFSSRLMERVRSDKGKTYGIGSQILCNHHCGMFMISTTTLSDQTAEVMKTILDVCRQFSADGVTEEELEKAKQFVIGNMAFQLEGIGNIADKLLWLKLYGRDTSYIEHFDEMVSSIRREDINEAIRSYLSSAHFALVAVGNNKQVRPQLADFGNIVTVNFRAEP
jgi:zinc protease